TRSGDFTLGNGGEFRLLELLPGGCYRLLSGIAQGFEHLRLADAAEIVVGGGREPVGQVETERSGEFSGMDQSRAVRTVVFHLDGVYRAGRAEGQEVDEDGLILLKTPFPQVTRIPGDALAPVFAGSFETLESFRAF